MKNFLPQVCALARQTNHAFQFVVIEFLDCDAGGRVNDEARASEVVSNNFISYVVLYHILRHVYFGAVNKARNNCACAVKFRNGAELILIKKRLNECAVYFFTDASVLSVNDVINERFQVGNAYQLVIGKLRNKPI